MRNIYVEYSRCSSCFFFCTNLLRFQNSLSASKFKQMAFIRFSPLFSLFLCSILLLNHSVKCNHDEEDDLYQGINKYRASLNLTSLTKNENANCFADELADQFKNQPCTNTTGANTIPGTEPQFSNYPELLTKCHLNVSNTRDGSVMPVCVPGLDPTLVLANFTQSLYSQNLNDSKYTGIGIGSEDNWIVAVLTTNTPDGSFVPETSNGHGANFVTKISLVYSSMLILVGNIIML